MVNVEVHGNSSRSDTQKVLILLEELSLKYNIVTEDRETSPFGGLLVKYGDRDLFGRNTIMRYIAQNNLELSDLLGDIETDMWVEVESVYFAPLVSTILDTDDVSNELLGELEDLLKIYDSRLESHTFLGGDHFTLVDIAHIPLLQELLKKGYKEMFRKHKNIYKWLKRVIKRESVSYVFSL